jgi:carboxymethylenebutenolidase
MPSSRVVHGRAVDIPTADGVADSYLVRPEGDGPYPGVLFIMDAFGLRPRIEEMAGRIAERGFVVLAPNVLYREGRAPVLPMPDPADPDSRAAFMQKIMPLVQSLTPERVASDAKYYLDYLAEVAPGAIAITGYCMGARVGWRIAAAFPDRVAALGGFHAGGLVTDAPDSPHRSADQIAAELYFGFADNDRSATADQIAELERALDTAGVAYRSEVYKDAVHGYTMSDTAAYDEDAAERHFSELFALLDRALAPA